MESNVLTPAVLEAAGADIRYVRGAPGDGSLTMSWKEGLVTFPSLTYGCAMEDGGLFAIYSALGVFGSVSHAIDVGALVSDDASGETWDEGKKQLGLLESEVLARTPWLEGRTLSQLGASVKSYQLMEYGWKDVGADWS